MRDHRDVKPTASRGACKGLALVLHQAWRGWQQLSSAVNPVM